MCIGGGAPTPAVPPLPPTPPAAPTPADPAVAAARSRQRAQSALAGGRAGDIASSPQGDLSPAATTKKTALGA